MKNVYVIWSLDGPIMATLLQFEQLPETSMAQHYVEMAYDAEFGAEDGNPIADGSASYELAAIFIANDIQWIY